ncbi:hypothetical protein HZC34_06960 [Candidatus Saganbacteria bacterium]|nr:hypothetical protein [Candidatus Saganbacteria bacterium]
MNPAEAEKKQKEILRGFTNSKRLKLGFALTELTTKLHLTHLKNEKNKHSSIRT